MIAPLALQDSAPSMTGRRFHCIMEAIPHRPWKAKSPLLPESRPIRMSIKKGARGVCSRYDTVLLPFISIARCPDRPPVVQLYRSPKGGHRHRIAIEEMRCTKSPIDSPKFIHRRALYARIDSQKITYFLATPRPWYNAEIPELPLNREGEGASGLLG